MRDIHISVVSHHQFSMVKNLLFDFEKQDCVDRLQVSITVNMPEEIVINLEGFNFPVKVIHNEYPKGFSANHNAAFNQPIFIEERQFFLIINPDVRLYENVVTPVIQILEENNKVGLAAPLVRDVDNKLEDSVRQLPTPSRIIAKLFGKQGRWENEILKQPDWVAGMLWLFVQAFLNE